LTMQPVTCLLRKFPPGAYRAAELRDIHLISFHLSALEYSRE
jgi:hypothetical protein